MIETVDENKEQEEEDQFNKQIKQEKSVNFCFEVIQFDGFLMNFIVDCKPEIHLKGYEGSKRYLSLNLLDQKAAYWKFIYDYRINNIVLLDDRLNEPKVNSFFFSLHNKIQNYFSKSNREFKFREKYSFLFDRQKAVDLGKAENLFISFGSAYRYTNFSINIFYISSLNNESNNDRNEEHEVRIYRFWAFDPFNQIPHETSYFFKFLNIINFNNPLYSKMNSKYGGFMRKRDAYPKNSQNVSRYALHAEYAILLF
jgi:hypothetical protein